MKNMFWQYYGYSEATFKDLWNDAIFVFDTSVLLDLYCYSEKTRDEFLEILSNISDRLWLPFQIGEEYFRKREEVSYRQKRIYNAITNLLDNIKETIDDKVTKTLNFKTHPLISKDDIVKPLNKAIDSLIPVIEKKAKEHDKLFGKDHVLIKLTELFTNKVGKAFDDTKLIEIYKDGQKRYSGSIPPGYMDSRGEKKKDDDSKYNDLVIWYQIIEKASSDKKPIILITNDGTEDWWLKSSDGRVLGPRPELLKEMYVKSSCKYYQYNADSFLKYARKYLSVKIEDKSIKEAKDVRVITSATVNPMGIPSDNVFGLPNIYNANSGIAAYLPNDNLNNINSLKFDNIYNYPFQNNDIIFSPNHDQTLRYGKIYGYPHNSDVQKQYRFVDPSGNVTINPVYFNQNQTDIDNDSTENEDKNKKNK
jgi:hypothetical protein